MKNKKTLIILGIITVIVLSIFFLYYQININECCSCCGKLKKDEMCIASCCRCIEINKR